MHSHRRAPRLVGLVVLLLAVTTACSDDDGGGDAQDRMTTTSTVSSGTDGAVEGLEHAIDVRPILADGVIDEAEMSSALDAFESCLQSEGRTAQVAAADQALGLEGGWTIAFDEPGPAADAALARCRPVTTGPLELAYPQTGQVPDDAFAEHEETLRACLSERGHQTEGRTLGELLRDVPPADLQACDEKRHPHPRRPVRQSHPDM